MGKPKETQSSDTRKRHKREGRGQGHLGDYKPELNVRSFPSNGKTSRILGRVTGRVHHLMSTHELNYFRILEHTEGVTDIREQFPLDMDTTLSIAEHLGVIHPLDVATKLPIVMTTDFLIDFGKTRVARAIKESKELSKKRVREKLAIEEVYWKLLGIDWKVVTEKEIDVQKAEMLSWLYENRHIDSLFSSIDQQARCLDTFLALCCGEGAPLPLTEIIDIVEKMYDLSAGCGVEVFKELVRRGNISIDMGKPFDPSKLWFPEKGVIE